MPKPLTHHAFRTFSTCTICHIECNGVAVVASDGDNTEQQSHLCMPCIRRVTEVGEMLMERHQ